MTRAHDKAILARLADAAGLTGRVFQGEIPKVDGDGNPVKAPQYAVIVHSNRGIITADRFTGPARRRRKTYWTHSVGVTQGQVDKVAELVLTQLLNFTAEVDGWQCERITHEASQPVQKDESTKPPLYFGVDQFDFYTTPLDPDPNP